MNIYHSKESGKYFEILLQITVKSIIRRKQNNNKTFVNRMGKGMHNLVILQM